MISASTVSDSGEPPRPSAWTISMANSGFPSLSAKTRSTSTRASIPFTSSRIADAFNRSIGRSSRWPSRRRARRTPAVGALSDSSSDRAAQMTSTRDPRSDRATKWSSPADASSSHCTSSRINAAGRPSVVRAATRLAMASNNRWRSPPGEVSAPSSGSSNATSAPGACAPTDGAAWRSASIHGPYGRTISAS